MKNHLLNSFRFQYYGPNGLNPRSGSLCRNYFAFSLCRAPNRSYTRPLFVAFIHTGLDWMGGRTDEAEAEEMQRRWIHLLLGMKCRCWTDKANERIMATHAWSSSISDPELNGHILCLNSSTRSLCLWWPCVKAGVLSRWMRRGSWKCVNDSMKNDL